MRIFLFMSLTLFSSLVFCETESEKIAIELTKQIIFNAEKKWPDNYLMQEYEIRQQMNALHEVQKLKLEILQLQLGEKK